MATRLTDKFVLALSAPAGARREVFDQEPGLMIRVSDRGLKTWFFRYRLADGSQPRFKLGTYPATSIKDARQKASAARRTVEAGGDPAVNERRAKASAREKVIRTYGDLVESYFKATEAGTYKPRKKVKSASTVQAERKLYDRHVKGVLGRRVLAEIGRAEVKTVTRAMLEKGITTQANHAHAFIRQTFSYAIDEELVSVNPALGLAAPAEKRARERVLPDSELKAVWAALNYPSGLKKADGSQFHISGGVAIALKLSALLMQRRAEVAGMRIDELDLERGLWLLPPDRVKNRRAHAVPLGASAVKLIEAALRLQDSTPAKRGAVERDRSNGGFVFPSPRAANGALHPDALTRAMGGLMKALGLPLAGPHDLRRTGASALASERLGVSPFIVSQVLNHTTDAGGGSATTRRHYNVHLYAKEKRAALEAWEGLLLEIAGERARPSNVTPLREAVA